MTKILMFHRIKPESKMKSPDAYRERGTLISLEFFESILDYIQKKQYQVATLESYMMQQKNRKTKVDIVLTFDDGYQDNFDFARPLLNRYGFKATFFPVTEPCFKQSYLPLDEYYAIIDCKVHKAKEREIWITGSQKKKFLEKNKIEQQQFNQELRERWKIPEHKLIKTLQSLYMNKETLQQLFNEGHEIGSHTLTHPILTREDKEKVAIELKESRNILQKLTGKKPSTFAYPDGRYDLNVISVVKQAGYSCATTVEKEMKYGDIFFEIPRLFVNHSFDWRTL